MATPLDSWEAVMAPLAAGPLWTFIRQAASHALENDLHDAGDFDSGISSSDINHRVFSVARYVFEDPWTDAERSYPAAVLTALVDQY